MASLYSGDYSYSVQVSDPADNPIVVTGTIIAGGSQPAFSVELATSGPGPYYAPVFYPAMVTNRGSITQTGEAGNPYVSAQLPAVSVYAGGGAAGSYVLNNGNGTVRGGVGVELSGGAGSVINSGRITATGNYGVELQEGGSVVNKLGGTIANGATANSYGLLAAAIYSYGQPGTVQNAGLISSNLGYGIVFGAGGSVTNSAGGSIVAPGAAFAATYAVATLSNAGQVATTGTLNAAVALYGGLVTNLAGGSITGPANAIILGDEAGAGARAAPPGTVLNAGIVSAGSQYGILLLSGGLVNNLATGSVVAPNAVAAAALATVKNAGSITAMGTAAAVALGGGGTLINQSGGVIYGQGGGAVLSSTAAVPGYSAVFNAGTISGNTTAGAGIVLTTSGAVTNVAGGMISGANYGVRLNAAHATASNAGTITAHSRYGNGLAEVGVGFGSGFIGGYLSNAASGTIIGGPAVLFGGAGSTLVNAGTLQGKGGSNIGVLLALGGDVVNQGSGTIAGAGLGLSQGVAALGNPATVSNAGMIYGHSNGILLGTGGTIKNQVSGTIVSVESTTAPLTYAAVALLGTVGSTITNAGTIGSGAPMTGDVGVTAAAGLYLNNMASGTIGGSSGISVAGGPASIQNMGVIIADGTVNTKFQYDGGQVYSSLNVGSVGVYENGNLNLTNGSSGLISGDTSVLVRHGSGVIVNYGSILANEAVTSSAYQLYPLIEIIGSTGNVAYISNKASGTIATYGHTPGQYKRSIEIHGIYGTVLNAGLIGGSVRLSSGLVVNGQSGFIQQVGVNNAVQYKVLHIQNSGTIKYVTMIDGTVTNSGTMGTTFIKDSGTVSNSGTIMGVSTYFPNGPLSGVVEFGTDQSTYANVDSVTNTSAGMIFSPNVAISLFTSSSSILTINNSGLIYGYKDAIVTTIGHIVVNNSVTGLILGSMNPIAGAAYINLKNAGSIGSAGTSDSLSVKYLYNDSTGRISVSSGIRGAHTVINAGTIGNASDPTGTSILLADQTARLVVKPGAVFYGSINGGNAPGSAYTSTIEFAPGTGRFAGFGAKVTNFGAIQFDVGANWIIEGSTAGLTAPVISGFGHGDGIDIDNFTTQNSAFLNGYLSLTNNANGIVRLDLPGNFTTASFSVYGDGAGGTDVTVACFLAGTRIATPDGETVVETLAIGDLVRTEGGALRPIRWIGRRSYAGRFLAANPALLPIRIAAGSLGRGIPLRDLFVSPNHAMLLDGVLVPADALVDGERIVRIAGAARVDYLHLELDSHDIILAEGAATESFLDDDSRGIFHNAGEFTLLYPQEQDGGRFCAPRVDRGFALDAIRRRLAGCAVVGAPGQAIAAASSSSTRTSLSASAT